VSWAPSQNEKPLRYPERRRNLAGEFCGSRTCKPNSVCGIATAGRSFLWATHCCEAQATYPEVVTRPADTCLGRTRDSLPIWSCSVWGLPCPLHYCGGGALLPHLFTLTSALRRGRYVFCGTFRRPGLNPASRTLSGTLLCGVRTFLPSHDERPSGPAANKIIISDVRRWTLDFRPRDLTAGAISPLGARKVFIPRGSNGTWLPLKLYDTSRLSHPDDSPRPRNCQCLRNSCMHGL
jgi:hypothetical protein